MAARRSRLRGAASLTNACCARDPHAAAAKLGDVELAPGDFDEHGVYAPDVTYDPALLHPQSSTPGVAPA